jgi:hypothetical protein
MVFVGVDNGLDVVFDGAVVTGLHHAAFMTMSTSRAPLKIERRAS